ncbi:MAG: DNA repair protein RadC [Rhodospirillales bacterium]|nr:DNA repair protein RadC [Rhodospirillales bacterium]
MDAPDNSDQKLLVEAKLLLEPVTTEASGPACRVRGDTHPLRQVLREAGGVWNSIEQCWIFSGADPAALIATALRSNPDVLAAATSGASRKPHYHGHRQRLRQRFMEAGAPGLADYELLELILFQCIARIDVKPIAKELIATFGSLGGVIAADPARLGENNKLNRATIVHLKSLYALSQRVAHEEIAQKPVLGSWDKLISYLKTALAYEAREQFHILFLNTKNVLIADEVQQIGTVNHTPVYPREVIRRALELGATALILVHNHPSGDPTPSAADIEMTRQIAAAGEKLDITLHDHIIMSKNGHTSFRDIGHI